MSKFSNDEYLMGNIDEKICIKPEYKKMLNNLLGISSRDNSTFSSSKIKNIDLYNILSEDDIQKIFTKNKFEVEISTLKNDNVILDLMESNDIDEFMEISDGNSINITITDRKLLEESFDETKQIIIEKINQNKNQIISKWKKLRNKYMDIQAQTNSWPLYVGSMFIKVRTSKATLYAPLLMKKVEIKITNTNKVLIRSIDTSIDINEKLLFLLQNEYKFNLPKLKEDEDFSFEEVVIKFTSDLKKIISNDFNFIGKFSFETKKTVINKEIQYAKGTILTFAQPSGGPLRNKMIQMIQNNEVENVLDIDVLKDVQQSVLTKMKSGVNFLKITATDISQEKAIIGSLEDSSIIWGPPGSGKSQTISNIISNLMFKNKTVIITSEKKAALDVLKNRMGVLDKYIFFGLVDKKVNKEEFYKPFQDLMNSIRKSGNKNLHRNDNSTIDKNILSFNKQKENILHENIDNLIRFHNVSNYKKGILLKHKNIIKNSIFINKAVEIEDFDLAIKECSIVKKGFIFKKYPSVVLILKKILIDYEISFEILRDFLKLTEKENITKIDDFIEIENEYLFSLKPRGTNNDIEYLNELFSRKFKFKIKELQNSERYKKRINTFIKNCDSGYRVPYKFVNIHKEIIRELFSVFVSTPQTLSAIIDMNSKY
ncbi:MAG: hypothetical protein KAG14_03625, partial [Mycoplasmataceae bacterium]|nr:hypothetical protein [Mycoplasmataceae bacterium]